MAGVVIELELGQAREALEALCRQLADTRPLMTELAEAVVSQTQDSFERQAGPDGAAWQPSLRAQLTGGQTLVDSGQLLASISGEVEVGPEAVIVGSSKAYAAVHQFGGRAGRGLAVTLPARPFLPGPETVDMAEINNAIERHFAAVAR